MGFLCCLSSLGEPGDDEIIAEEIHHRVARVNQFLKSAKEPPTGFMNEETDFRLLWCNRDLRVHDIQDIAFIINVSFAKGGVELKVVAIRDWAVRIREVIQTDANVESVERMLNAVNWSPPSKMEILHSSIVTHDPSSWYIEYNSKDAKHMALASELLRYVGAPWAKDSEDREEMLKLFAYIFEIVPDEIFGEEMKNLPIIDQKFSRLRGQK